MKKCALILLMFLAVPVFAAAPQALSVLINGQAMQGKALWYKGRIYVPLEDVASSTHGTYRYDQNTGKAEVTVGQGGKVSVQAGRPHLKVKWEKKYVTATNAQVLATIVNNGQGVARNVEAVCTFKDPTLRELSASMQRAGDLKPGESRTLEFRLYEQPLQSGNCQFCGQFGGQQMRWSRINHELTFNYN